MNDDWLRKYYKYVCENDTDEVALPSDVPGVEVPKELADYEDLIRSQCVLAKCFGKRSDELSIVIQDAVAASNWMRRVMSKMPNNPFAELKNENIYVSLESIRKVLEEDVACLGWVEDIKHEELFEQMRECFLKRGLCKMF